MALMNGEPPYMTPDWMHPLCFPLARDAEGCVVGLLRWPKAKLSTDLPVVRCEPSGQVAILAKTVSDYATRLAAELDFAESPLSDAAVSLANEGWPYEKQLEAGSVKNFGRGLERYLILRVGPFPDTYQALARGHLDRRDATSALITAEKACAVFPEFGALHVWQAAMLSEEPGYGEEARDAARNALEKPLWTLGISSRAQFESLVALAEKKGGLDGYASEYRRLSLEVKATASADQHTDNAARAMDEAVLTAAQSDAAVSWASLRPLLAETYAKAAVSDVARLCRGLSDAA
jgi:hypothetical protein